MYETVVRACDTNNLDARQLSDIEYGSVNDIKKGDAWIPGPGEEIIVVDEVYIEDGDLRVALELPDRDHGGKEHQLAESFLARIEADGGWHYVPLVKTDSPAQCPHCSSFIPIQGGNTRLPWSGCDECQITLGIEELKAQGKAHEVRL